MAGFGAALGKLKDFDRLADLGAVPALVGQLMIEGTAEDFLISMNKAMAWVATNAKKIGNAQRMYFHFYFRDLFNSESDAYLRLDASVNTALHKLKSQLY